MLSDRDWLYLVIAETVICTALFLVVYCNILVPCHDGRLPDDFCNADVMSPEWQAKYNTVNETALANPFGLN